ncbi:hypothetical protein [Auritidibacter ignavus]|uniref:hypothetical protein n=1 Tax=Auritidibacter ignavus TaxID=678932 RepID=UPI0011B23515
MKHRVFPPRRASEASPVPAVLPLVVLEAYDGDQLVLTVNGDKATTEMIKRGRVGARLTELIGEFDVPTRVEVHEQDGTVHADILQPPPKPDPPAEPDPVEPEQPRRRRHRPELVEVEATGFVPGEEVAVAVILQHGSAGPDGRARALINRAEVADPDAAEVVLLGRISGTAAVRPLT